MKILHDFQIFYTQKYGGVSRYHMELVRGLKGLGEDAEIFVRFPVNHYYIEFAKAGKTYQKIVKRLVFSRFNRALYRSNQKKTLARIRRKKYDIVHLTWTDPYLFDEEKCGSRIIVTVHDMIHELIMEKTQEICAETEKKKRAIYESDGIIAISENTKADVLKLYPDIDPGKIRVIYHGTNRLSKPVENAEIKALGRYILFVGVRAGYKRGMWFLREIAPLLERHDLKLLFAGGGSLTEEERKAVAECSAEDRVRQMDLSDGELAFAYKNAVCFVYPTLYEGFGFPILEAFDNGCPVVCTDSSSLPEVGGDAAMYFDRNDADAMRSLVSCLCEEPDKRDSLIKKGSDRCGYFTWEKTAEETLKFYKDVMTGAADERDNA